MYQVTGVPKVVVGETVGIYGVVEEEELIRALPIGDCRLAIERHSVQVRALRGRSLSIAA